MTFSETLQIAGWFLTVLGQIQIVRASRNGFLTWMVANVVMIVVSWQQGMVWSVGMFVTNLIVCIWSFRRWSKGDPVLGRCSRTGLPCEAARART